MTKKEMLLILFAFAALLVMTAAIFILTKSETKVINFTHATCYRPAEVTINKGDKIVFNNIDLNKPMWPANAEHPHHSGNSEFDAAKEIEPGESYEVTMYNSGVWEYHDHVIPECSGTITVN